MKSWHKTQFLLILLVLSITSFSGCQKPTFEGSIFLGSATDWEEQDIGAVTFFTRLASNIPDDKHKLVCDVYQKYGSVSLEWVDKKQKQVDILVKGAPIEWASSFVQENIELVDKKLIYWRLDEVWYRANFQLYTISFPFKGKLNPDAKLFLDTGSGMELVELEKDGSFLVMLPFSLQKTVAFAKIELKNEELSEDESGNVIRYKRINITNNTIDDISKQDYLTERSIIYSSFSSNEGERDAELTPIEDYVMPETPEPGINEGPTEDWFKIDESKEPEIEGFLTKNDPLDKVKSEDINAEKDIVSEKDKNAKKTDVTKPEEKSDKTGFILPKRKGEPPKILEKPVPIDVYLVFKGLEPGDKTLNLISDELRGFIFIRSHYDELEEAYIFRFRVYEISDIKRIHNALSKLSTKESLQMSNRSRYFGVKMTPLDFTSELRTKITGHVLPNSVVTIFVSPKIPEHVASVDEAGNFSTEIPLPAGTSFVYGKMIVNNEPRFFQIAVLTGKLDEITKNQYNIAIREITENFNKNTGKPK